MKKLFLMLVLMLTMMSCAAQDTLSRGRTVGKVIEATEDKAVVDVTSGGSLVVNGKLETGKEYDIVYDIVEKRPDGTLIVKLVAAEPSDRQNAIDRNKLTKLLYK